MNDIGETAFQVLSPLEKLWEGFVHIFPGIVAAIIILILGYLIALLLGKLVHIVLAKLKVDKVLEKLKAPESLAKLQISAILGQITKWYIFIIFFGSAAEVLTLGVLSDLLREFVLWLPRLIIAMLALLLGIIVAYYVEHIIDKNLHIKNAKIVSIFFKALIIFIAVVISLEQVGIEVDILRNTFLILIAGLALGFGIAIGIGFGSALKKPAAKLVEDLRKKY